MLLRPCDLSEKVEVALWLATQLEEYGISGILLEQIIVDQPSSKSINESESDALGDEGWS